MKTYEKYKPSGIEFIGDIPEKWESSLLKRFCNVTDGSHFSPKSENIGKPYVSVKDIGENSIDLENCNKIADEDFDLLVRNGCCPTENDILLTKDETIGRAAIVTKEYEPFVVLSSLGILSPNEKVNSRFLYFYLISGINVDQMFSTIRGSALTRLTIERIKTLVFICPTLPEQTAIADYLDEKTEQIDKLIANKERLIKLLKEERTAIINQAVTKGINPDAKLKPSGIDWLGDIPEHWEVKRFKFVAKIKYGLGQPPNQKDDGLPLIRATNVERGRIVEKDLIFVDPEDIPYDRDPILKEDDIIIVRSGAYTADSAIIPKKYDGAVAGYDMVVRVYEDSPVFISYCLLSNYVLINQLYLERLRAAQPHLNKEELGETLILLPKIEEQKEIVKFIESKTNEIDSTISKIEKEIELIKEYRTALISEVVTGKIKVI